MTSEAMKGLPDRIPHSDDNPTYVYTSRLPIEWRVAIFILLSSLILLSGFFDSLVIQVLGYEEVPRSIRILTAIYFSSLVGFAGLAAYAGNVSKEYRTARRPSWETPLHLMLFFLPFWFLIGFINDWPVTYLLGDVFMLGIMPMTYFTLSRRPLYKVKLIFNWLYGLMIFAALLSAILVFYNNVYLGNFDKVAMDAAMAPILYTMLSHQPHRWEMALLPVLLIAAVLSSKRSSWATVVIAIGLALILRPGIRRTKRLMGLSLLLLASIMLVYSQRPGLYNYTTDFLERRWDETVQDITLQKGSDLSFDAGGRAGEVAGIVDTMIERQVPADWVVGLGLGAVVQARGGRLRHHIHSTPGAFLARTGIIGLGLWLWFLATSLYTLLMHARKPPTEWHRVQFLFWSALWISMMIFSLKSQAFWGSILGGIQLAYLRHLCYDVSRYKGEE